MGELRRRAGPRTERARRNHKPIPRLFEQHTSRLGGVSGGLGRGGHTRDLWGKIEVERVLSPGACWLWRGYCDKDGYGKITVRGGKTLRAARWLWEQERGPVGEQRMVNLCGVRKCVNPAHKKLGTQADAIALGREAGRYGAAPDNRGELSPKAKLTDEGVLFARAQLPAYGLNQVLARLLGASPITIGKIRARKGWKHLGNGRGSDRMSMAEMRALADERERDRSREDLDHAAQSRSAA